ncbi:M16 family metallopeptidase [Spirochaeta dissipatitropha]
MKKKKHTSAFKRLRPAGLYILALALILFAASCATGTETETETAAETLIGREKSSPAIENNPALLSGRLENGLDYYILPNAEPSNRVFLRLVVNVGSIMETPEQLGLAHFVEHAAFLGTEDFSESEIVGYLESLGMRFGPDINAYTSFDETVYMLQVPADDPEKIERGLHILQQWAHAVSFPEERIIRERGVIQEEWRYGQGAQQRLRDAHFPVIFKDSLYAERLPIGDPAIFMEAGPAELREFYKTWYRPDLMAVVAVGEFDPEEMESRINSIFSTIPGNPDTQPRPVPEVPVHSGTLISTASDPELTYSSITIYNRMPSLTLSHEEDYRSSWTHDLFAVALSRRIEEKEMNPDFPMLAAGAGFSELVRIRDAAFLYGISETELLIPALEELILMILEIQQHGFTESEIESSRRQLLRSYQDAYNEQDFIPSSYFAGQLSQSYLSGGPAPGIVQEWELASRIIPDISSTEVSQAADAYLQADDQVITISVPEYYEAYLPSNDEIADFIAEIRSRHIEASERSDRSGGGLMEELPASGSIISRDYIEDINLHEWQLSNNMKVYLLPTDFRSDEILLFSYAFGGHSLVEDDQFHASNLAASTAWISGLADFPRAELNTLLAGHSVDLSSYIDFYDHGFYGESSRDDAEIMFQLAHLYSSSPRLENEGFSFLMRHIQTSLQARRSDPDAVFADRLQDISAAGNIRYRSLRENDLEDVSIEGVRDSYVSRFSDLGGSVFFLVGAFEPDDMAELVETYIASLPGSDAASERIPRARKVSQGIIEEEIAHGQADSSRAAVVYHGSYDASLKNDYLIAALADTLRIRLREVLREDEGGTYGVSISHGSESFPTGTYRIQIDFNTSPSRVTELTARIHEETERLGTEGPDESLLQRVREIHLRDHESNLESNDWWLWELYRYHINGNELTDIPVQKEWIDELSLEQLQEAANQYLRNDQYIQLIMHPAE